MLEFGLSLAVAAVAIVLTVAVVSTLLPAAAGIGGVAATFLGLTGALSGYSAWRWVRWVRNRVERMHWSVVASLGAAVTTSELFGMFRLASMPMSTTQQLLGLSELSLLIAATLAAAGAAALSVYRRCETDQMLVTWAEQRCRRITASAL
jgi:biotin transporter BioY